MHPARPLWAVVDHKALLHNLRQVRQAAPASVVMAVIKANAYGHGAVEVGRTLAGVDDGAEEFAVISLREARHLREAGIERPITLLQGPFSAAEIEPIGALGLRIVVHHRWQVAALEQARPARPLTVWLKVDTGMHRLGVDPDEVPALMERLRRAPSVAPPVGLMSHLACADQPRVESAAVATGAQIAAFARVTDAWPGHPVSLANSAAVMAWPDTHPGVVRPGIMLYGASPFDEAGSGPGAGSGSVTGIDHGLRPVMHLYSALISVRQLRRGDAVGYGGTWTCPEPMPVGLVAGGYGDGYPRHAPSGTPVWVAGRRVPLIGRVSMDSVCVDLRECPDARVGDPVTLWGEHPHIDEVAAAADTIAYELLTGITARVPVEHRR